MVVLDTNFLLIPGQFKVDIFAEFQRIIDFQYLLAIYSGTIDELTKIATANTKDKNNAKIALGLIKQKNLKTLENSSSKSHNYIDQIILDNVDNSYIVCTQDMALKRLLKTKFPKIRIITLKSKKYLGFE